MIPNKKAMYSCNHIKPYQTLIRLTKVIISTEHNTFRSTVLIQPDFK